MRAKCRDGNGATLIPTMSLTDYIKHVPHWNRYSDSSGSMHCMHLRALDSERYAACDLFLFEAIGGLPGTPTNPFSQNKRIERFGSAPNADENGAPPTINPAFSHLPIRRRMSGSAIRI